MTNKVQYATVNGRTVKITETVDGENIAVPSKDVQTAKTSAAKTETATAAATGKKE